MAQGNFSMIGPVKISNVINLGENFIKASTQLSTIFWMKNPTYVD